MVGTSTLGKVGLGKLSMKVSMEVFDPGILRCTDGDQVWITRVGGMYLGWISCKTKKKN